MAIRPPAPRDDLLARRARFLDEIAKERERFEQRLIDRCRHVHLLSETQCRLDRLDPTIDVLMLSGGGDRGAFGAGFLNGWGEVRGQLARPDFDCVTGVSTGALIAPYAFIGTDESYADVLRHYANPDPGWARRNLSRALILRSDALFDNSALRSFIRAQLSEPFIAQIADAAKEGRALLIGTTAAEMGLMRVFDITHNAATVQTDACVQRMADVITASIAIPGVFPPVEIHGELYVDGGVTMQVFLPGARRLAFGDVGLAEHIKEQGLRVPTIRVWAIVNNALNPEPTTTQPRWFDLLQRSLTIASKTANVIALRDLQHFADVTTHKVGVPMVFRYVAIPDSYSDEPGSDMFDQRNMSRLAELGVEMGRNPESWRATVPAPESADTYELEFPNGSRDDPEPR